jgi:hypothetical protein
MTTHGIIYSYDVCDLSSNCTMYETKEKEDVIDVL